MNGARRMLKTVIERAATDSGCTRLLARVREHQAAIVAYHNVVMPEDVGRGDASLHLALPRFVEQVERLQARYEIVDLETAAAGPGEGPPRVVITFDDAYRGAVTLALPELTRRGLPATMFVAPGLLGRETTWWDALGEAGLLTPARRATALAVHGGRDAVVRSEYLDDQCPRLPVSYGIATAEELEDVVGPLCRLGSHSWGHEHLPSLDGPELRDSLRSALTRVAALQRDASAWLALPYGANSPEVTRIACDVGHTRVLEIAGGTWPGASHSPIVPRINVPAGMSARGLELRTSGLLG